MAHDGAFFPSDEIRRHRPCGRDSNMQNTDDGRRSGPVSQTPAEARLGEREESDHARSRANQVFTTCRTQGIAAFHRQRQTRGTHGERFLLGRRRRWQRQKQARAHFDAGSRRTSKFGVRGVLRTFNAKGPPIVMIGGPFTFSRQVETRTVTLPNTYTRPCPLRRTAGIAGLPAS